jgi:6-phospho-beta-glucosidase
MNVLIAGGSAPSTPALIAALAASPDVPAMNIVLAGRSESRLRAVTRASRILARGAPLDIRCSPIDAGDTFQGSDVIVLQVRPGGYAGREFCETFPTRHGLPGDQALGPGGMAAAWIAGPSLQTLCARIHVQAPQALLIVLTSPLGILVRLISRMIPAQRTIGLCELPWTTLSDLAHRLGIERTSIGFDYCGVNHLGWFHRVDSAGIDLVERAARWSDDNGLIEEGGLIRQRRAIPTKYWQLHVQAAQRVTSPLFHSERAQFLMSYARDAIEAFHAGDEAAIRAVVSKRETRWYADAVAPLLLAMCGRECPVPFFITAKQAGRTLHVAGAEVAEYAHDFVAGDLVRRAQAAPVPDEIARLIARFVDFERMAAIAVERRERSDLVEALRSHPWVLPGTCAALADDIMRYAVESPSEWSNGHRDGPRVSS